MHLSEGSFAKTDASGFDLSSEGRSTDSFQPYVGLAAAAEIPHHRGTEVTPELRLGYACEALSNSRLLTVAAVDGPNFQVAGVNPSRSQMTGGVGFPMQAGPNLSFYADYDTVLPTGNPPTKPLTPGCAGASSQQGSSWFRGHEGALPAVRLYCPKRSPAANNQTYSWGRV